MIEKYYNGLPARIQPQESVPLRASRQVRSPIAGERRAFLTYALRRLGLDVPEEARPAGARRLKLLDRARISALAGIGGRETERFTQVP